MFERVALSRRVGEIFNTLPRDGNSTRTFWIPRRQVEETFENELDQPGVHICLDGPTGSGKSSLATTVLKRKKIPFKLIQVTKSMGWGDVGE